MMCPLGCLAGRSALPWNRDGWTPWHAARPPGASGGANEVGHRSSSPAVAGSGAGLVGGALVAGVGDASTVRPDSSTGRDGRTSSRPEGRRPALARVADPRPEPTPYSGLPALSRNLRPDAGGARQAINGLKNEGLVHSEHGRGVFVRTRPTVRRLARNRFTKAWRESGGEGRGLRRGGLKAGEKKLIGAARCSRPRRSPVPPAHASAKHPLSIL